MPADASAFAAHRRLLFDLAYRMLGRVAEAEDAVQETWLRWQKQDAAAIDSPRAWLAAAVTRLCIDQLRSAQRARTDITACGSRNRSWKTPHPRRLNPLRSPTRSPWRSC